MITYKCQRQGCDYTELAEIPVKNTNAVDGKTDDADTKTDEKPGTDADGKSEDGKTDASEEDKNSNTENASVDKDSTSGKQNLLIQILLPIVKMKVQRKTCQERRKTCRKT